MSRLKRLFLLLLSLLLMLDTSAAFAAKGKAAPTPLPPEGRTAFTPDSSKATFSFAWP